MKSITDTKHRINNSCLCCIYCGKSYKTKINLDKHLVLCEIIHRSKNNKQPDDDIELPSQRQMYNIILELTMKYNKLEEKMLLLDKWLEKKKKKINVIELLNTNVHPEFLWNDISEKIIICDKHIDCLLSSGVVDAFYLTMNINIFEKKDKQPFPLFCLDQKQNCIYVYAKQSPEDNPAWLEIGKEELIKFMGMIQRKLIKGLTEWRQQLEEKNLFTDGKADIFDKSLLKMLNMDFKQYLLFNKIRGFMYERMKIDAKLLVEYEFEF